MIIERLMKLALLGSEWVLYLLLGLSVLSIATMVERFIFFARRGVNIDKLRRDVVERLADPRVSELGELLDGHRSLQARIARVALHWVSAGNEAVNDAVEAELAQVRSELEKGTNLLGTLGNNAPFVGLFGTVLGVIIAFEALGGSGGNADAMGGVMAGIAEALVATGVGLFVALPAVVAYNLVQKKIGDIEGEASGLVKLITAYAKSDTHIVEQARELRQQRATIAHLPAPGKKNSKKSSSEDVKRPAELRKA